MTVRSSTEPEWFTPHQLITRDRWTPVSFDVLDDEIRTLEVSSMILMKGVRQIAAQYRLLAKIDQLTNAKGSTEHADVGMNAHHDYVLNAVLLEQIEYLLAVIADSVLTCDLNRLNLIGQVGHQNGLAVLFQNEKGFEQRK